VRGRASTCVQPIEEAEEESIAYIQWQARLGRVEEMRTQSLKEGGHISQFK